MRKISFFLLFILLFAEPFTVTATAGVQTDYDCVAFIKADSAAEGSSFNFFFAVPLVQYVDNDGVCRGAMFDTFVFEPNKIASTPNEAEQFIADLMSEHENLDAIENAAIALKEDEFADKDFKLKIYVSVPFDNKTFANIEEQKQFTEYFVHTLYTAYNAEGFENIELSGLYFDEHMDDELTNECQKHANTLELDTWDRNQMYHITLGGVPDNSDKQHYNKFKNDYDSYTKAMTDGLLGVHFDAFTTLHDCAIATSDGAENAVGRDTYDFVHGVVTNNVKQTQSGRKPGSVAYAFYAFVATAATACGIYVIVACLRKALRK